MGDQLVDILVERLRSAARAGGVSARGWQVVRAAAALREDRRYDQALSLLDGVVEDEVDAELESAVYACAVAIHCDVGRPEIGIRVGRPVWDRTQGEVLGKALARAYWDRAEATGDPLDRDAWAAFGKRLEALRSAA